MTKIYFTLIIFLFVALETKAQTDTIYTVSKTILGKVREVGEDIVYSFPGEEVNYRIKKRQVLHIVFASGRKEHFNSPNTYRPVSSYADWRNVTVTFTPEETEDMAKIVLLTAKASGLTTLSNTSNVQNRAFEKIKKLAAMMGGNVVLINSQAVEGNIDGYRTSRSQLMGTVYRSVPFDTTHIFTNMLNKDYKLVSRSVFNPSMTQPSIQTAGLYSTIRIKSRAGFTFINGVAYVKFISGEPIFEYIVTKHADTEFTVVYQKKTTLVELKYQVVK
jgi:hypothetical protein